MYNPMFWDRAPMPYPDTFVDPELVLSGRHWMKMMPASDLPISGPRNGARQEFVAIITHLMDNTDDVHTDLYVKSEETYICMEVAGVPSITATLNMRYFLLLKKCEVDLHSIDDDMETEVEISKTHPRQRQYCVVCDEPQQIDKRWTIPICLQTSAST
jgi:hypothetical protein